MIHSYTEFVADSAYYLELARQFISRHRLTGKVVVDHICYKCESSVDYETMRTFLEGSPPSKYFYQVYLSGRRVAYLRLKKGLKIERHTVNFIELADKKPAKKERWGFHHVEIYPSQGTYQDLLKYLEAEGVDLVLKERPHHTTHDIFLTENFIIRLTDKPLIQKIIQEEM